jgi:putative ABC transport system permease protein
MFRNYFLTAIRNFLGNKVQALIQVVSLAIGITASLSIGLYILHEVSTDKFNRKIDRIYRVEYGNQVGMWSAIGHQIAQEIPEVEKVVRLINWTGKDRNFTSPYSPSDDSLDVRLIEFTDFYWCDCTIFDIFTIPPAQGDPRTVLRDPHSCVISETVARKFFPDRDPVGEVLWDGGLVITGVFEDVKNSHIVLNMLISIVTFDSTSGSPRASPWYLNDYADRHYMTCVLVNEGVEGNYLETKIYEHFYQKWTSGEAYEFEHTFRLRPLRDIYFSTGLEGESNTFNQGNLALFRILMVIVLSVLALGIINYINLTTARSTLRAREAATKKAFGGSVRSVLILLSFEYLKWILLSVAIASPLAYIIMDRWLQGYAYRTGISWWVFALAILFALLITLATVTWQSMKTARTNPVESLRYE